MLAKDLINRLNAYGADVSALQSRFLGDADFYCMCLDEFFEDSGVYKLKRALDNKNYEAAFNEAHDLKGSCGNMALMPLYNSICVLVEALRSKNYAAVDDDFDRFNDEFNRAKRFFA